jgi:hypothetical protein
MTSPHPLIVFMWGALAMGSATAGLFFLRFWRQTKERLFGLFGAAFFVLALNWIVLAVARPSDESRHYVYLIRLAAYSLLIAGIIDKNRR